MQKSRPIEMEYKRFKLIAHEQASSWQIKVSSRNAGRVAETMTYLELGDALDEAKKIVDLRNDLHH